MLFYFTSNYVLYYTFSSKLCHNGLPLNCCSYTPKLSPLNLFNVNFKGNNSKTFICQKRHFQLHSQLSEATIAKLNHIWKTYIFLIKMSNLFISNTSNITRNIQINSSSGLVCACSLWTLFFKDQPKHFIHFSHA